MRLRGLISLFCCTAAWLLLAQPAGAAHIVSRGAKHVQLATDNGGRALVTYEQGGRKWHVFYSGAINARQPTRSGKQVEFKVDYSGGRGQWKHFKNTCKPYDGPELAFFLTGCKASDGTYWALQLWPRSLPNVGYTPWTTLQKAAELRISHWSGPLAQLEAYAYWLDAGSSQGVFGRATYLGKPIYGFRTSSSGSPLDDFGRLVYLDTFGSAYGSGWRRENSFVVHNPSGMFCYAFKAYSSYPGYPHQRSAKLIGTGQKYRLTLTGPGVTPDVLVTVKGLPTFDPANPALVDLENQMTTKIHEMAREYGDSLCGR